MAHNLQEMLSSDIIAPDEQTQLAIKAKTGDKLSRDLLIKCNLKFVVQIANQYQNHGLPVEDLISEGALGIVKAIERFEPKMGNRFITYAGWWIRQAILQTLAEHNRQIRLPANRISILTQIKKTGSKLQQKLQRDPTEAELLDELDLEHTDVYNLVSFSYDDPDAENRPYLEILPNEHSPAPDAELMEESLRQEIAIALRRLDKREREILQLCFGIGYSRAYTLEEIGDMYHLTRERIRQLKEKALKELRRIKRQKKLENLKDY